MINISPSCCLQSPKKRRSRSSYASFCLDAFGVSVLSADPSKLNNMDFMALKSCTQSFTRVAHCAAATINPKLYPYGAQKKCLLPVEVNFTICGATTTNKIIKSCCLLALNTFVQKYFASEFVTPSLFSQFCFLCFFVCERVKKSHR